MEESMHSGTSTVACTTRTASARMAGSSASGMPAFTSSMCPPAAPCPSALAPLLDEFQPQLLPLALLLIGGDAAQPPHDLVGNHHAGDVRAHPFGGLRGPRR